MVLLNGPCRSLLYGVIIVMTATSAAASLPSLTAATSSPSTTCEVARLKCAYRVGCGMALQNYLVGCADIMSGRIRRCSDPCKKALIALTSTEEGQDLMRCDCQGQEFCEETKQRVEVCRPEVMRANEEDTVVSCSVAQWICMADPLCSTAVEYYRRLCRSMFQGRKCTMRCNNSIAILNRQEKAAKLKTCMCDGTEDYNCRNIKLNMDRLCFHKPNNNQNHHGGAGGADIQNEIQLRDSPDGASPADHRQNTDANLQRACSSPGLALCPLTSTILTLLLFVVALTHLR